MSENRNKGLFYGLLVVGIVVVSIVGATFAYFSASNTVNNISGKAGTAALGLTMEKFAGTNANGLIPLNDSDLTKAINSTTKCVDKNSNDACQLYEIIVTNEGTSTSRVRGTLSFTAKTGGSITNLKWQRLTGTSKTATFATAGTSSLATASASNYFIDGDILAGGASKTYYLVVWISNKNEAQNASDKGEFTGTLTFETIDDTGTGSGGVVAEFE